MNEPLTPPDSEIRIPFFTKLIGTGLYSGYAPIAPGTAGSFVGVAFYLIPGFEQPVTIMAITLVMLFIGIAVSSKMEKALGEDPPVVVIDEVVGQWISYMFLPKTMWVIVLGFFFFRGYDIVKPQPARSLEKLKSGWGIMMDDVAAGIYANLTLQIVVRFFHFS